MCRSLRGSLPLRATFSIVRLPSGIANVLGLVFDMLDYSRKKAEQERAKRPLDEVASPVPNAPKQSTNNKRRRLLEPELSAPVVPQNSEIRLQSPCFVPGTSLFYVVLWHCPNLLPPECHQDELACTNSPSVAPPFSCTCLQCRITKIARV